MEEVQNSSEIIMAALLTLTPHQFCDLKNSLSSDFRLQQHRRSSLLHSPTRFNHALHFLQTLSFHQKTILIARYLLTTLKQLTRVWEIQTTNTSGTCPGLFRLRDTDAVSLLMLLCEVRQHDPQALDTSPDTWRDILNHYFFNNMLTIADIGVPTGVVLSPYIDIATRCRRFLDAMGFGGGKAEREVAASAAVVVALPSVEVCGGVGVGVVCVICREEMREGRDVCELPCQHLFHWMCVLPWLKKKNTCPCCRFQLPTDDVFGEIERLWGILVKKGTRNVCGDL